MQIDFYTGFAKKENSTKRPVTGSGVSKYTMTGNLKEPCSILNPVISLQGTPVQSNIPAICTYAYISAFNRYYWVDDWTFENGLWVAHLDVDVLASWKTAIGEESEYILRTDSSTTNFNGAITDTMYPATTDFQKRLTFAQNVFSSDLTVGCYVVGIISGDDTYAVGAISYYAMTSAEFGVLKDTLFSDTNLEIMGFINGSGVPLVEDISPALVRTLYNPFQYIASCTWFPFTKEAILTGYDMDEIKIGWWTYDLMGTLLYAQTIEFGESMSIQQHPQSATRGKYLNYSPYTKRTLIGRFGTVAIDNSLFVETDNISIGYLVDLVTGQCRAKIEVSYTDSQQQLRHDIIAERHFLLGVPIQLAQVGIDYLGTAVSAINTIPQIMGGAISGIASGKGAIMGAIAGGASGIYNTLQSSMPQLETSGINGSFIAPSTQTALLEQYFIIVDEDIHHKGRPLCEIRKINTLSGYILCAEGEIDIDCYDSERTEILKYLTTGFFWE